MRYISTRGKAPVLSFDEAMLTGLARDSGLYLPERVPSLSAGEIAGLAGLLLYLPAPYTTVTYGVVWLGPADIVRAETEACASRFRMSRTCVT